MEFNEYRKLRISAPVTETIQPKCRNSYWHYEDRIALPCNLERPLHKIQSKHRYKSDRQKRANFAPARTNSEGKDRQWQALLRSSEHSLDRFCLTAPRPIIVQRYSPRPKWIPTTLPRLTVSLPVLAQFQLFVKKASTATVCPR